VELALRYRTSGERRWHEARTKNVSASGVLFEGEGIDTRFEADAAIEMRLLMPAEVVGPATARAVCRGRVVRLVARGRQSTQVAATIDRYRLERVATIAIERTGQTRSQ
jgi:hypothetical protein